MTGWSIGSITTSYQSMPRADTKCLACLSMGRTTHKALAETCQTLKLQSSKNIPVRTFQRLRFEGIKSQLVEKKWQHYFDYFDGDISHISKADKMLHATGSQMIHVMNALWKESSIYD